MPKVAASWVTLVLDRDSSINLIMSLRWVPVEHLNSLVPKDSRNGRKRLRQSRLWDLSRSKAALGNLRLHAICAAQAP